MSFDVDWLCRSGESLSTCCGSDRIGSKGLNAVKEEMHEHIQPYLVCGDGTSPPFQHKSSDAIMALDLLGHLDDDLQAVRQFVRLLRPEGSLVIFGPAFEFLWSLQESKQCSLKASFVGRVGSLGRGMCVL